MKEKLKEKLILPSNYWEMPDYYYPGIYSDLLDENLKKLSKMVVKGVELPEIIKIEATTTRNEVVLNECGWYRKKYDKYEYFNKDYPQFKISFNNGESQSVSFVKIDSEGNELESFEMPFALICGIFLRCRELEFSKPNELDILEDPDWKRKYTVIDN